jgi:serine/threonine protein kinase
MRLLRQSLAVVPLSGPANESFFAVRDAARSFACIGFTMRQAETDLFTLLAARRRLSKPPIEEADAAELLAPIVVSLRAFHAVGIVHRDVKPANIFFFDEESNARLGDFGLSRQILPASGCDLEAEAHFPQCINQNCDDRSPPSDYVCTRWYRAPELLVTDDPGYRQHWAAPTAVDMWALGCVLFELLLSPSASAPASRTAGFLPTIPKGANGILFPGPASPGPQLETIHRVLAGRQSQPETVSFWEAATGRSLSSDACAVLDALLTLDPAARATAGVLEEMEFFRAHVAAPHVAELGPSIARALTPEVLAEHATLLTASTLDWDAIVALLPTVIPSDRVETLPPAEFGESSSLDSHKAVSPGRAGPCCAIV